MVEHLCDPCFRHLWPDGHEETTLGLLGYEHCIRCGAKVGRGAAEHRQVRTGTVVRALDRIIDLQTRALLAVEWQSHQAGGIAACPCCPSCEGWADDGGHRAMPDDSTCPLDAALTACGIPDQASRYVERERRASR